MNLLSDQSFITECEIREFEAISDNSANICCKGGIVMIPKGNYDHLGTDEYEHILIKFLEIQENKAEIPKTLLLKAQKTISDVRILGQMENYVCDDGNTIYVDLLRGSKASASAQSISLK